MYFIYETNSVLLINGFWPMAVWRLAHERSQDIVLMMRTVGMRPSSYLLGMFSFDMFISVISGTLMILFVIGLKLSRFEGAPIGLLVAVVCLSAWALNSWAWLSVAILGKKSSILTMIAPCLLVASSVAVSLINIILYPNENDWPWAMNLFPFFAQGRVLYLVLVYHRGSKECDVALSILFLFGATCLVLAYIIEADIPIITLLKLYYKHHVENYVSKNNNLKLEPLPINESLSGDIELGQGSNNITNNAIVPSSSENNIMRPLVDVDVIENTSLAASYSPDSMSHEDRNLAIVIQKLRHVFSSTGLVAVDDFSLVLRFGECFGLLGPNGAGILFLFILFLFIFIFILFI